MRRIMLAFSYKSLSFSYLAALTWASCSMPLWSSCTGSRRGSTVITTQSTSAEWEVFKGILEWETHCILDDVEAINEEMDFQVPKYLLCNKKRFPYWFGEKDERIKTFQRILKKVHIEYDLSQLKNKEKCQNLFTKKYLFVNESVYQIVPSCELKWTSFFINIKRRSVPSFKLKNQFVNVKETTVATLRHWE